MINRSLIRLKIVQLMYAYYQNNDKSIDTAEKELLFSLSKAYDLYNYMLITTDPMVKGRIIRTLGKMGYTAMKDDICAMFANSAGYMRASILVGLRELGLRGPQIVEFYKNSYKFARREKVAMTALDALYCCGEEGKAAFLALEQAADAKEKIRFEHIKNPITNDRAYER